MVIDTLYSGCWINANAYISCEQMCVKIRAKRDLNILTLSREDAYAAFEQYKNFSGTISVYETKWSA